MIALAAWCGLSVVSGVLVGKVIAHRDRHDV